MTRITPTINNNRVLFLLICSILAPLALFINSITVKPQRNNSNPTRARIRPATRSINRSLRQATLKNIRCRTTDTSRARTARRVRLAGTLPQTPET